MLVDREVIEKLPIEYRQFLTETLGCFIFKDFCQMQITKIETDIQQLVLTGLLDETYQLCEDMRLVRRFWIDLQVYSEDLKQQNNRAQL